VMLTSRADNAKARLASAALAVLHDYKRRTGKSAFAAMKTAAE
jgi:hypothetical protein